MSIREEIGRIGLKIFANHRFKFKVTYTDFHPKRKSPYFLIANHTQPNDPLFLGMFLKYYPYPVANALLYTKPMMRFGLNHIVTSIMKRKGQSDIQTIKQIIQTFNKKNRGVMLFPEGNASYFGKETPTDYISTAKLIKKINKDVIMGQINGGFFAQPRWGKYVKKGAYHVHFYKLLSESDLETLSVEEIAAKMETAIKFNDYEWNRVQHIPYRSQTKAEGLEYYLYACPVCNSYSHIHTSGNEIFCPTCGKIGEIDLYNNIKDSVFNNLVDWGDFQEKLIPDILKKPIISEGELFEIYFENLKRVSQGQVKLTLTKESITFDKENLHKSFLLEDIKGFALTQKNFISFDHENETYDIKIDHPKLILDAMHYLKKGA
ncbi:MAG: 1-acyl-sn-glycerol-3-phosphate acyltransferase [Bacillota bacterium]|nr:MAG: 1-acyl-sn-glycerol-3-phosphate acyltransferase [Bacillota bacterium]